MQVIVSKPPKKIAGIIEQLKDNKFYIILLVFLIFGMLIGSLTINEIGEPFLNLINEWFKSFVNFRSTAGFIKIFFNVFLTSLTYIFLIGVSAFGIGGLPIIPLIIFLRGYGTISISSILYCKYSLQGIAFADLILLPSCIALDFIILYFSSVSFKTSYDFLRAIKYNDDSHAELRLSCVKLLHKALFCLIAIIIASLIEAAFTACFIDYFNFT